ncbi:hypothetical protein EUGRSUZ_F01311 [Eucalyptus grandis]|uniref:Uncharacterized protein n=2 Tax=Eucalyptus grandis TaxID=71139 RepID=A0ACC3KDU2_EUCGR|nr:hypothetical protein EUGRSUZ_F01311 [Eucalyptus grandis]
MAHQMDILLVIFSPTEWSSSPLKCFLMASIFSLVMITPLESSTGTATLPSSMLTTDDVSGRSAGVALVHIKATFINTSTSSLSK